MATFAEWLKEQADRDDRIGFAARAWENAKVGRVSSPGGIIKHMSAFRDNSDNNEQRGQWSMAILGVEDGQAEYRQRPDEPAQSPGVTAMRQTIAEQLDSPALPVMAAFARMGQVTNPPQPPAEPPGEPQEPPQARKEPEQPPEGGIPLAVREALPLATEMAKGAMPGSVIEARQEDDRIARVLYALDGIRSMVAEQGLLLQAIAEYVVMDGDREALRRSLARIAEGSEEPLAMPSMNWAEMYERADHHAEDAHAQ